MINNSKLEVKLGNYEEFRTMVKQNFEVYCNGEKITKNNGNQSVIVINKYGGSMKIPTNDPTDERYITKGQAFIGDIFLDPRYQNKGLSKEIYQTLANKLNVEIVKGDPISAQAQKMWKKFGDKISPEKNTK